MSPFGFRPMTAEDLPTVAVWLRTPEVVAWWGEPDEQYALLAGDLDDPAMRQWIVSVGGEPFAYTQDYDPNAWGMTGFVDLPAGARGMDTFIGAPDRIGAGHGSALLRLWSDRLLTDGAPVVFVDPDPDNDRAIRAYAKAGFEPRGLREVDDGEVLLMVKERRP